MFRINPKLEPFASHTSLNRARWTAWIATGAAIATVPLCPALPLMHLAAIPAAAGAAWALQRRYRRVQDGFEALRKERGYRLGLDIPMRPVKPGETVEHWAAEWVPFNLALVQDTYHGSATPRQTWRKRLAADKVWSEILDQQLAWVREHAPARWETVSQWWESWYLHPLLQRRHGTLDVGEDELLAAAHEMKVDLHIGAGIAGQPELWTRRLGSSQPEFRAYGDLTGRLTALPARGLPENATPPPFPLKQHRVLSHFFIGRGFLWDQRHTQAYRDLLAKDLTDLTTDPKEQGDPRVFGIGDADVGDQFMDEAQFNQMLGIFGANGVGKTRWAEIIMTQVLRSGFPILVIDPKSDRDLLARVVEECRRWGRAHQFRYTTLAKPRNEGTWDFICRYNALGTFIAPEELAARVAAALPQTKEPFWTNVAKGMAQTTCTLAFWANWFLRFLARSNGPLPDRGHDQVPRIILAMQWARHHLDASPADADAAVGAILEKLKDPTWKPRGRDEQDVLDVLSCKSLGDYRIYSPIEWVPTIRHISEYMIDNTMSFVGWMLKIFYGHSFLLMNETASPDFPKTADNKQIVSKGSANSLWSAYLATKFHPLELRYEPNSSVSPDHQRWVEFYHHFVPEREGDTYMLKEFFASVKSALGNLYNDCLKDRQKFLEYATTLSEAIKPFLGSRKRTVCPVDSDIRWEDMVRENQVVYVALASQIDRHGASAMAKMLLEDLAAYCGQRYQYNGGKAIPFWVIGDECSEWVNDSAISLLNKGRGSGLRFCLIGQSTPDLTKNVGPDGAKMVKANLNTFVQLRTQLSEDAREFSERASEVLVAQTSHSSSLTPGIGDAGLETIHGYSSNQSSSTQRQEVKRIPPGALLNLPRGQAFVHAKGQVYLVQGALLDEPANKFQEEIGLHDEKDDPETKHLKVPRKIPGVMADPLLSYDEMMNASRARAHLGRPAGQPTSATLASRPPSATASGSSSLAHSATLRPQSNAGDGMAEGLDEPAPSSAPSRPPSSVHDATFDPPDQR